MIVELPIHSDISPVTIQKMNIPKTFAGNLKTFEQLTVTQRNSKFCLNSLIGSNRKPRALMLSSFIIYSIIRI